MEIKINELDASTREVEANYTYEEIKADIEKEVAKQAKKLQVPGFRKGKVPASLLKKMYGDALEYEAAEKVANNKFWELDDEKHFHPIGRPVITALDFKPEEKLSFKIKFEVLPEITPKDYTGQEIEIFDLQVKDEDIQHEIDHILKSNETLVDIDVVEENSLMDVVLSRNEENGEPVVGAKPEQLKIDLANQRVHPDIIANAKGKKIGETFNFTFEDVRKEKNDQGEEVEVRDKYYYTALIKSIQKSVLPELNEELIKKVTKDKVSTEEDLRKEIKHDIEHYFEHQVDDMLRSKLMTTIVKNNEFTPPAALVTNFLDDMVKREEEQYKKQGYNKYDKTEARNRLQKSAEFEVQWYLLRDAIVKKENIQATDEDLQKMAEHESMHTGIPVDKLLNYYKSPQYNERISDQKLFDYLKANNTIKKVDFKQNQKEEEVNG